ncbi:trans-resveratrol di-O-methyltransferase [Morus notabilis]|nr:trans-resveratrol di-O-methyltransferase [Morus notabilis]
MMSSSELLQAFSLLRSCSISHIKSMSLKCAIELGIPYIIHNHGQRAITFSKLIESLPVHPSKTHCIYRIMRLLVHSGFFATQKPDQEEEEEAYTLTNASRLLLTDTPVNMESYFLLPLLPQMIGPWQSLSTWLQSNDHTLFKTVYGGTIWDQLADDPELNYRFNEAMASDSRLISKVILDSEYIRVFEGLKCLVDVGGGSGTLAKAIANTFPHMKCTVFDLPHVVANVQGTTDNLSFIGGNMFSDPIPPADAILLKMIMHNWNDEDGSRILKRCREAILSNGNGGKVIVIDTVIGNEKTQDLTETKLCNDVIMMTLTGKERSLMQWEKLILTAQFSHYKITPIFGSVNSIIEVYP